MQPSDLVMMHGAKVNSQMANLILLIKEQISVPI